MQCNIYFSAAGKEERISWFLSKKFHSKEDRKACGF
jgi:hypothetical protein